MPYKLNRTNIENIIIECLDRLQERMEEGETCTTKIIEDLAEQATEDILGMSCGDDRD